MINQAVRKKHETAYGMDTYTVADFLARNNLKNVIHATKGFVPDGFLRSFRYDVKKCFAVYSAPHITANVKAKKDVMFNQEDARGSVIKFETPTNMEFHVIPFLSRLSDD